MLNQHQDLIIYRVFIRCICLVCLIYSLTPCDLYCHATFGALPIKLKLDLRSAQAFGTQSSSYIRERIKDLILIRLYWDHYVPSFENSYTFSLSFRCLTVLRFPTLSV